MAAPRFIFSLALVAGLSPFALAHGETASDLGGRTLCLDAGSARVELQGVAAKRAEGVQAELERTLRRELLSALTGAKVRFEQQASCSRSPARAELRAGVRYLNPENYEGFGDPAYSYSVGTWVGQEAPGGSAVTRFSSGWSDIHSESRTKRPFEDAVRTWGAEEARDLASAWRRDNPTLGERLARLPPPWQGAGGLGLGALVSAAVFLVLGRRNQRLKPRPLKKP